MKDEYKFINVLTILTPGCGGDPHAGDLTGGRETRQEVATDPGDR